MSESSSLDALDASEYDSLEAAIAENPDAVAAFVRRLDAVNELLDVVALGTSALEDDMVAELAGTAATLAEAGDGLATDETVRLAALVGENGDELAASLETLVELQRAGTLDELVGLVDAVSLLTAALEDDMVTELARTGSRLGEVADEAADPDAVRGLTRLVRAVSDAETTGSEPVGPVGLVKSTRDPEVQAGLGYLLALARAVGRQA
ncbi:DUF1641 domain-containing protein [Salinigranum halophilum]|jgi:uncharacterized protein YjgD (DUF1641 family)|uniref:DUF1641 domain-containing protein n=1 Tax=Salinigranum halophilum TaxID=2565931 RepID=UPI0010A7B046|nr:DUF1641 domain-containing protein [Salinigranum halophilum]